MINENRIIEIIEIINDLVIEANIIAKVTSAADKGAPIKSTILPIIFPINNEEDECENACCIICIEIKPGQEIQ